MRSVEAIVVGNGLAGCLLVDALDRCGASCAMIDDSHPCSASRVAPGIVNPLAGKRMLPSWNVEEQLPRARATYRRLERTFGIPLFTEMPIIRILRNEFEEEIFARREGEPGARRYIGARNGPDLAPGILKDPRGSFTAHGSGRLDIRRLQDAMQTRLNRRGLFMRAELRPSEVIRAPGSVRCGRWTAPIMVFCRGWRAREDPFFPNLPFKPAKGEMLTLVSDAALPTGLANAILNCGKWLLPLGNNRFRAGATYSWDRLDPNPTQQGRTAILGALAACISISFQVVGHDAGVRPAIADYRPVIGRHPQYPEFVICNGFGSKGALVGPSVTAQLAAHLCHGDPIPPDIDVRRFKELD